MKQQALVCWRPSNINWGSIASHSINRIAEYPSPMPSAVINVHFCAVNSRFFCQVCQHLMVMNLMNHVPILQEAYMCPDWSTHLEGQARIRADPVTHPESAVVVIAREAKPSGWIR